MTAVSMPEACLQGTLAYRSYREVMVVRLVFGIRPHAANVRGSFG